MDKLQFLVLIFAVHGDLTDFIMAVVRHLGFVKFNVLTVGAVKRDIG